MVRQGAHSPVLQALLEQFEYDGIQTCAADGTCSLACPVGIDTGLFVKELRSRAHTPRAERVALSLARRWDAVERSARAALRVGAAGGDGALRALSGLVRDAVSHELIPSWGPAMPAPAPARAPATTREGAASVYFPACVNRIFGNPREHTQEPTVIEALVALSARAGQPLWIPPDVAGKCCATPWSSKGYRGGQQLMARRMAEAVLAWTREGELPLVLDASSCTQGLLSEELRGMLPEEQRARLDRVQVIDSIEWVHDRLLGALAPSGRLASVALHPPCAAVHLGLVDKLRGIAERLAEEVIVPLGTGCCGMAGDRGLLHPESARRGPRRHGGGARGP